MERKKSLPICNNKVEATTEWIKSTTKESDPVKIKSLLSKYKNQIATEQVVCDVIDKIIFNGKLLNKVAIVSDISYGNCAIIIKSNKITVSSTGGYSNINPKYTYTELLKYFEERAEKVFVFLDDEVKPNSTKKSNNGNFYNQNGNFIPNLVDSSLIRGGSSISDNYIYYGGYDNSAKLYKITDGELNIAMLKGELSLINEKINECLDISSIDNCDEKKYFYKTMFEELSKEKERIVNKLNNN